MSKTEAVNCADKGKQRSLNQGNQNDGSCYQAAGK